uniref:1,4-alpha-glucan branching enzyme GlgB n=1 Tax=Candidatus Kentrum eta TaxID=2126337 RepID=A0A450U595_9GAMM|nr:MAG: 1,4-alpha-glucan branching enzyme [Candidatus Kentron sp. H]VFJ88166.1 MAG: 1,4-alpha-glucan branching enzyme [Candidatus Kentron sp. H]VFJ95391.1 MAG: 1,4-alpha-glucan branching enzyme [Candidatus Kentron sp. H]
MTQNTKADSTSLTDTPTGAKTAAPKIPSETAQPAPKAGQKTPAAETKATTRPGTTAAKAVRETPPAKKPASAKPTTTAAPKTTEPKAADPMPPQAKPAPGRSPSPPRQETPSADPEAQGRPSLTSAAATADHKTLPPGIDAMALLKRSEGDPSKSTGKKPQPHRSAAEVIAKTASRDHARPAAGKTAAKAGKPQPEAQPDTLSGAAPKAGVKPRLTSKVPLPPEPKGPVAGMSLPRAPMVGGETIAAVLDARLSDPFAFFGQHKSRATDARVIRVFYPEAIAIQVLDPAEGTVIADLKRVHDEGLFVGEVLERTQPFPYRLRVATRAGKTDMDDPYRFPPVLSDKDVAELRAGESVYDQLGAHPTEREGVSGVAFAVWAPNASRVAVVGDFNNWDGRRHGMRFRRECGVWEIFLPGVKIGALYKYEIKHTPEAIPELKSDPIAFATESPLGTASIVHDDGKAFRWRDDTWMKDRRTQHNPSHPISFYEVHLGSWRRKLEEDNRWLSYREMADELVAYCLDTGFTHIALLPVTEYIYDDTVGYLPSNLYAPTNRYGSPDDFRYFVDACHRAGLGVVADWVPTYFSEEENGLAYFDGTALYEYGGFDQRRDPDWNTPLYDLTRKEVVDYLTSNALYWFERFHLDGLRISGLAKLFYLDYGRPEGGWSPNAQGGNENLEALAFIRHLNERVAKRHPGAMMVAEDSSLRGELTKPVPAGGLGFTARWNTAWAYDTLRYLRRHPVHRRYYHYELTNPLNYFFDEAFVLPVSYDHVSIGQGSMVNKLPGDYWQKFATLRAWYALMYALPSKKLLFMGTEFSQDREWNSTISLDWHLLDSPMHRGMQSLIRDLNRLYQKTPALHEGDSDPQGFEWIDTADDDSSVISFLRWSKNHAKCVVVVTHITPVVRTDYRIGVPKAGYYREVLNTDAEVYGGGNQGSAGGATAEQHWAHGREHSLCVTLPPYATVAFELE